MEKIPVRNKLLRSGIYYSNKDFKSVPAIVKSKHGSATVFLCIIMSALILSQSFLLAGAVTRSSEAEMRRCMQLQTEQILCGYNDKLLKYYGIYVIDPTKIDKRVFDECNRILVDYDICLEPYTELSPESIGLGITDFMKLRFPTIVGYQLLEKLKCVLQTINESDLYNVGKKEQDGKWSEYLKDFISSADKWTAVLENVENFVDIIDFTGKLNDLKDFIKDIRYVAEKSATQTIQSENSSGFTLDIFDPDSITNLLEIVSEKMNGESSSVAEYFYLNQYAAGFFDSAVKKCSVDGKKVEESNIYGIPFSEIHGTNRADIEYLLTGSDDEDSAIFYAKTYVFAARAVLNIGSFLFDTEKLNRALGIAEVISTAIAIISAGTVIVEPQVVKYVILLTWAIAQAFRDVGKLIDGEEITLIDNSKVSANEKINSALSTKYRDYISFFLLFVDPETIHERIKTIFEKECGEMAYIGISMSVESKGKTYLLRDTYDVYKI